MTQAGQSNKELKLGLNGLGRIGKLTLWRHAAHQFFSEIVVNLGRSVGTSLEDLAHYVERDSTYGSLHSFLHGFRAGPVIGDLNPDDLSMTVNKVRVRFLVRERNPLDLDWDKHGVELVVDTTGRFLDPTQPPDAPGGSILGHLEAGARKVIVSAPFKIKDRSLEMPRFAITGVMGINHQDFDPRVHTVVSNASCSTSCLAHMVKPLLDHFGSKRVLSASMATVHAATASQAVLDRLPGDGATDLRKTRSTMDNIILTSTGAAKTLSLVIPEMRKIGFIAESVRIPSSTGSLIILVVNLHDHGEGGSIRRELINQIYQQAAERDPLGRLLYSDCQNVSSDIRGCPKAAAIIEGHETHTRTAEISLALSSILPDNGPVRGREEERVVKIPITQAVIYGWYDNEFGSYTNLLGDMTEMVAQSMK